MQDIPVNLVMKYFHGTNETELAIGDDKSNLPLVHIKLTPENIRDLIRGSYLYGVPATLYPTENLGKNMELETHTFTVKSDDKYGEIPKWLTNKVEKLNVDGWICDKPYKNNMGSWVVVARRYN